jgi:branched-chain amino acid transport system permease protein
LQFARDGLWLKLSELLLAPPAPLIPQPAEPLPKRASGRPIAGPMLLLEEVTKRFGGLTAVNAVSFAVPRGEIVALIGPNGAGKSTTFDLITGMQDVTSGRIAFDETEISNASPNEIAALGIGRNFQHTKLIAGMSLLENVALGAHQRGSAGALASILRLDRPEEATLLQEADRQIARVGLSAQRATAAGNLALGQQRIAEIARALALDPRLLLLDEPAAGLRHFEKEALAKLLRQLRDEGLTILLVEHDMGFVMGLVDRIVVLDFGSKIAEGKPEAIRTDAAVIEAYLGGVE